MKPVREVEFVNGTVWDASEMFSRGRTNSPKGQMTDPTWRAGFARLAPLNLTFEAWLYHPQLMELAELARAFPQTTIILNHVGGPLGIGPYADKKQETFAAWKAGITELGRCQNVVVKLGGLGMLFGMFDFHTRETPPSSEELARAYKPYIETCIAAFRPDRGMFESNFPPDGVSSTMPSCGTPSNSWPQATRRMKRPSCSAGRQSASTVSPRSRCRPPNALAAGLRGKRSSLRIPVSP
jgi:predicted TIM-barrel fold metal-dependent hydrolase